MALANPAIAALAMYDWPEVQHANDALWEFIANRLRRAIGEAPGRLDRSMCYHEPWQRPELVMAQACGYPFATELRGKVQLVGTPCYSVPGCDSANYSSMIVASLSSGLTTLTGLGQATAAVNSWHSQSGHWALRAALAGTPGALPPKRAVLTGSHRQSLRCVASGTAEVAAIDAVCWALANRYEAEAAAAVRVIGTSPAAPGLPVITALGTPPAALAALRASWIAAVTAPELREQRDLLFLSGFEVLNETAYDRVTELERLALSNNFPRLAH